MPDDSLVDTFVPPGLVGTVHEYELRDGLAFKVSRLRAEQGSHAWETPFFRALRLILVLEGETRLNFGGHPIHVPAGNGVLLGPCPDTEGSKHHGQITQQEIVLFFEAEWLTETDVAELIPDRLWRPHHFPITPAMQLLCRQLLHQGDKPARLRLLQQESISISLLLEVQKLLFPPVSPAHATTRQKRHRTLMELLHSGQADGMTIQQMAQSCYSNPTTLQRDFQAEYGMSIATYLRGLKMQRAARLLDSGANLLEAALAAGYRHPENFSRAFHRHYGYYPRKGHQPAARHA